MPPPATPLIVHGWIFSSIPTGWEGIPGTGLRRTELDHFPSSVVVVPDELPAGETLAGYVERQLAALREAMSAHQIEVPRPGRMPGVEETLEMTVRHSIASGPSIVQRQLYTRRGRTIGVITETTTAADWEGLRATLETILGGLTPPARE